MKIELETYEHTCADGCCYTTGYDVFVDGEKIGSIGEDATELAELLNEHFNTRKMKLISLQPFDDEYQVFDFNDQVLFKGTQKECMTFMSSSSDLRCVECGGNKDVKLSAMQNFQAYCEDCRNV